MADQVNQVQNGAKETWRAYARWFLIISVVFFSVYPLCNWLTAQRGEAWHLYLQAELYIPFMPVFIWAYLSLYVLFLLPPFVLSADAINRLGRELAGATVLSGIVFLLFPASLGFPRHAPEDPLYGPIFAAMFSLDHPHNMAPSLHVVYSALMVSAFVLETTPRALKMFWWLWLFVLTCSTLLVHQHHLLDVVSGLLVAIVFRQWTRNGESHA